MVTNSCASSKADFAQPLTFVAIAPAPSPTVRTTGAACTELATDALVSTALPRSWAAVCAAADDFATVAPVGAEGGAVACVENEELLCDARVLVVRRRPGVPPGGRP